MRYLVDHIKFLSIPEPSKMLEYECKAISDNTEFVVNVYRSSKNASKCTFQARTKGKNEILIRLDVNPGPHRNPDNTVIYGTHLHIYKEGFGTSYAFPFDVEDDDLVSNFIEFLEKFNVLRDGVQITQQDSLFS